MPDNMKWKISEIRHKKRIAIITNCVGIILFTLGYFLLINFILTLGVYILGLGMFVFAVGARFLIYYSAKEIVTIEKLKNLAMEELKTSSDEHED